MKKILLSLVIITPLITGCSTVNTDITINDNKSAQVVTELNYAGRLNDAGDNVAKQIMNNYSTFLDNKYRIETAFDSDKSNIKATKKTKNIEVQDLDLSSLGFSTNLKSGKFIEINKNFLISSYNVDLVYDYAKNKEKVVLNSIKNATPEKPTFKPEYYQMYGDSAELENQKDRDDIILENLDEDTKIFNKNISDKTDDKSVLEHSTIDAVVNIKVPGFASYNNADSSVGNVYTWNIKTNEPTEIKLQYVRYSGFAILFVILIGVGLLVILTRRIIKHEAQKRMDNVQNIV